MQLSDLRTELIARGEDFLDASGTTRQDLFINTAYQRINEASEDWPWLFADASGTSPLTIADLRAVLSVVDASNKNLLNRLERRLIVDMDPTLVSTGTPTSWYRDQDTQIKVWPATAVTLNVRYLKVPATLSNATDTPVIPARWHALIVDGAMVEAFKDSEDYSELQTLEQLFQSRLSDMRRAIVGDGTDYIEPRVSGWLSNC